MKNLAFNPIKYFFNPFSDSHRYVSVFTFLQHIKQFYLIENGQA